MGVLDSYGLLETNELLIELLTGRGVQEEQAQETHSVEFLELREVLDRRWRDCTVLL
jgi:hypothetical protein